ncbi:MAG: extracellular solute-binding protein [Ruminiclostridium sp.]|nr:extracellular solute-binding protein [Ruminiclostridium sp.]
MKRLLSTLIAAILVPVVLLALTACGGPTGAQTPDTNAKTVQETGTTQAAQATDGQAKTGKDLKAEISLMHFFVEGDGRFKAEQASLKAFNEKYPGVTVKEEANAVAQHETKMKTLLASNELPDVFTMRTNWTEDFVKTNAINPCDDFLNADPEYKSAFIESFLNIHKYNDKIYSIPFNADYNAIVYYNKALFDKYNLTYPKTWDELLNVVKVFNTNNIIPFAVGNSNPVIIPTSFISTFMDRIAGTEYVKNLVWGDAKWTDGYYAKVLDYCLQLADIGGFNKDFNSLNFSEMPTLYGYEKAAMTSIGNWLAGPIIDNSSKELQAVTEVGLLPSLPDGKGDPNTLDGGSGWGWNINAKLTGDAKEAAINLLKAMTDRFWAKNLVETASMNPVLKNIQFDDKAVSPIISKIIKLPDTISGVTPVFDQVLQPEVEQELEKATQAVMAKSITPDEAAKKVQAVKERVLAK